MAKGLMASYTGKILWKSPKDSSGIGTYRVNGSTEVYAGFIVTGEGHTHPDVAKCDADADRVLGVAINQPGVGLATAMADNSNVDVAHVNSGAGVWVFVDDDEGALIAGTALYGTGTDDDGFVEVLAMSEIGTAWNTAVVQAFMNKMQNRYVGVTIRAEADQGSDDVPTPIWLR